MTGNRPDHDDRDREHGEGRELVIETADRLRLARLKAGIEQEEMAEVLGVSSSTISNWEHGRTAPKDAMLVAWAQVTGFRLADLLGGTDAAKRQQRLASRTRRTPRRHGTATVGRLSWLPRMDSNHQPPDWVTAQQSDCIRAQNVTNLLDYLDVCPGTRNEGGRKQWYETASLSYVDTPLSNTIKPTSVTGFGGDLCYGW